MKPFCLRLFGMCMTALLFVGCNENDDFVTPASQQQPLFTASGTVSFKKPMTVPDSARFHCIWRTGSYYYCFGEGSVDFSTMTFTLTFYKAPPDSALHRYSDSTRIGVGSLLLLHLPSTNPRYIHADSMGTFYGAVNNAAVIFLADKPSNFTGWQRLFAAGYNMGKGVDVPADIDSFVTTGPRNLELLISDDPKDVTFPEWM